MKKQTKTKTIEVEGTLVRVTLTNDEGYISLTDIARYKDSNRTDYIISNWFRNRDTLEYLGIWEEIHNPDFNPIEFDGIKKEAGLNSFIITAKQWCEKTKSIGIKSKTGRYGGTYAHNDIAFEFATWISPKFKLFLIKEFQRLKKEEIRRLPGEWDIKRLIAKSNYRIHTDAIKSRLLPKKLTSQQMNSVYASEADMLNVILFGKTAQEWREEDPKMSGSSP